VSLIQSLIIAVLQGATELFPVSSLGHAVIVPKLLHWNYDQSDPTFLPFLVLLHLGTATALLILYWRDWVAIITGFVRAAFRGKIETADERTAMLLVAGTIPAGVVGVVLQTPLEKLFAAPTVAAVFLIVNGFVLIGAEMLRRRDELRAKLRDERRSEQEAHYRSVEGMPYWAAFLIGVFQSLALIPGISRSGVTMAGGLVAGLRHQEAARFSFLMATPIILGAGVLEVPLLFKSGVPLAQYALGAVVAGVCAYVSARFLIRWFKEGRLDPYGVYCIAAGVAALLIFSR
jgi:undecaprenyl-diphosphatase